MKSKISFLNPDILEVNEINHAMVNLNHNYLVFSLWWMDGIARVADGLKG